jgi:hypothetical protein
MNYHTVYKSLVKKRKSDPSTSCHAERHHIIPKSIGGDNKHSNIVLLSPREHFIAHLLLVKMQIKGSVEYYKMLRALSALSFFKTGINGVGRITSSRMFEYYRVRWRESMKHARDGLVLINDGNNEKWCKLKNIPEGWVRGMTERHKKRISETNIGRTGTNKGKKFSKDHCRKISQSMKGKNKGANNGHYGKQRPDDVKRKISIKQKGIAKKTSTRKRMSEAKKGTNWITNGVTMKQVDLTKTEIPNGWFKGRCKKGTTVI